MKKNIYIFYMDIIKNNSLNKVIKNDISQSKINYKYIIISFLILILICFVIYILICIWHYYNTECYDKKTFFGYLFDFKDNYVCIIENEPILPEIPIDLPPVREIKPFIPRIEPKKEVFHISNQDYTYQQSKCKCESYGGRLATKGELIDAYNSGANWCTYGWTDNQSAYYPVQKCEWDNIQKENERLPESSKKYCGMPGINGGFFANPEIKFGANCYGIKPKGRLNKPKKPYCPPMNFCKLENNFQASHKLDTDEIVGFNNEQWSLNI